MSGARGVPSAGWRARLHTIVFEADTPAGRTFDVALVVAIFAAVLCVMLETVGGLSPAAHRWLWRAEWGFTVLFTVEYVARLISVGRPVRYATSFFGIVDLLAVLPTYLSLLFPGAEALLVIRALRLLRVFRVLKLGRYLEEAAALRTALYASRRKIIVFLTTVLIVIVILGTAMYLVEGPEHGFTSIPISMYWAIVTVTTVGYGDLSPGTPLGKVLASLLMILGYSLIIVPTGILSAELSQRFRGPISTQSCPQCSHQDHDPDARHCKFCGSPL